MTNGPIWSTDRPDRMVSVAPTSALSSRGASLPGHAGALSGKSKATMENAGDKAWVIC